MATGAETSLPLTDFFLRLSFEMGINPTPSYGVERSLVATRVTTHLITMLRDKAVPQCLRAHIWIRALPDDAAECMTDGLTTRDLEFALALSDAYLDWLYA